MTVLPPRHAAAFGRAARYDDHARVQRHVAAWLGETIAASPPPGRVLEIGCGTGFLRAATGITADDWLMTDIAPNMIARAQARFADTTGLRFGLLDAEHPRFDPAEPPFDLIAGSLVVQWFDDLAGGLGRLYRMLAPGGRLIVTTLAAGSFAEWRVAHEERAPGTRAYPDAEALAAIRLESAAPDIAMRLFRERHADARAFVATLKAIGAGTPRTGHRPLAPAALRRVFARFEAQGGIATYEVALLAFRKPDARR